MKDILARQGSIYLQPQDLKVETRLWLVQGQPCLHIEFKASVGYIKLLSTWAKERVGKGLQRVQQLLLNHKGILEEGRSGRLCIRKLTVS